MMNLILLATAAVAIPSGFREETYLSLYEEDEGEFHDLCGSSDVLEFGK